MILDCVSILNPSHTQCSCPLPRTRLEQWEPNKILLTAHNPLIPCFKGARRPTFSVNTQIKTVTLIKVRNSLRVHQDYKKDGSYHGNWWQMAVVGGCRSRSVPSLTLQGVRILLSPRLRTFSCHSDSQSRAPKEWTMNPKYNKWYGEWNLQMPHLT